MRNCVAAIAGLLLSAACGFSASAGGFVNLPFQVEGAERTAALYVPPDYSERAAWPLIVYLHGGGGKGDNEGNAINEWLDRQPIARTVRDRPEGVPALVLVPRCPEGKIWSPVPRDPVQSKWRLDRHGLEPIPDAEVHVTAAIEAASESYAVDADRITVAGHSMGGEGSIRYAAIHADRIAGVAPSAGSAVIVLEDAPALARIGVWIFQGENDQLSTVALARRMVAAIRSAGGEPRYTEYEDVGHGTARLAFGDPRVIEWLLEQKRRVD